jgi:hypothetical protein
MRYRILAPEIIPMLTTPTRFRKLRIAWSVGCGITAVLLAVLWVRSYFWWDVATFRVPKYNGISMKSFQGQLVLKDTDLTSGIAWPTGMEARSANDYQVKFWESGGTNWAKVMRPNNSSSVTLNHRTLIMIASVGLIMPWIKLRWRFSLRTMLVATTLVAAVLWLIMWRR